MKELKDAYKAIYEKKANDGNLANNAPPYDKVTRRDVITGALGKDEMGGKRKAHDCAKKVNYKKEEYDCIPEQHTMLEDGTVTHYDITNGEVILENVPVEDLEILISEKHEHFDNYDKNAEMLEGYKEISFDKHQRMYDRYKKLTKAAIKDARDSGEASGTNRMKMGKMSAVLDKSSENLRKKQTKGELTGRGPRKEEVEVEEGYKGKHGQTDKQYADSRSPGGKMVSGDSKMSGAEYTHGRRVKAANPGMQPDVGGKTKPKSQGKMDRGTRADLQYRKANLKKEELEATGKFTAEEIERILDIEEGKGALAAKAMAKQGAAQGAGVGSAQDYIDIVNKRMATLKSIIPKTAGQIQSEHHQKDDEGNVIEHEETTPSSVEEGLGAAVKVAGKMIAKQAAQSAAQGAADRAGEAAYNKMRNVGKKPQVEEVEVEETTVEEGMKQARKNVGASTCWDGYQAKGTKKKGGKEVPNCVKEEETGGVLVQDAADYTPTEIETVDVVKPEPLKFQIEDHTVKFSEKNEEVVVDPTELVKKHAPNIAAARPLDEIAPALAVGAKVLAKKVALGAAKSAARGAAMGAAQNKLGGGNDA
tara:strand:- start:2471 stop:4240 length:1770 start_codon:yes stop_codon:yes gene_type:complete